MTERVFNFSAGPATLPLSVMERVRDELLDFGGLGASVMEISHLAPEFKAILAESERLIRELLAVPQGYQVLFCHGGAQMQFSAVPMNLLRLKPARKAAYVVSGNFAGRAAAEAGRFGVVEVVATSQATGHDRIPEVDTRALDPGSSYLHITGNNTVMGTQWREYPQVSGMPLVVDATSELLSRPLDFSRIGVIYAGAQKNFGPPGVAVVIVRDDLLGHGLPNTPKLLDYARLATDHSLGSTANTFSIYVTWLMLQWIRDQGGMPEMRARSEQRAKRVYEALDRHAGFYRPHAQPGHRSLMNATFRLASPELEDRFVRESEAQGLYGLKGHKVVGGIRASLYNAMPLEGAQALAEFMQDFARRNG
ncbi:MAG: 3-phosphoserine/phosphohydroxythreonine transaminase [Deltaproteobacteria bacterium]|nr:3-phosphoserine/phosphohydroxythreonine transaminase [Deltaproteobacteria bacterium]